MSSEDLEKSISHAKKMTAEGQQIEAMSRSAILPIFTSPVTAYRWNPLAAKGGEDDYFSSDLDDATIKAKFERINKPMIFLPRGQDDHIPPYVDREESLRRRNQACRKGIVSELSNFVPEGDHAILRPTAQVFVSESILNSLEGL